MKTMFRILIAGLWSLSALAATITTRFAPITSSASITGTEALWQNPAGLAFMGGLESLGGYLYEFNPLGNRHHGGLSIAYNFLDTITFATGLKTKLAFDNLAKKQLGSDVNAMFGAALSLGDKSAFGLSILKTRNFLHSQAESAMVSFGLQTRPTNYLALGGFYQEVYSGFFKAPRITAGAAFRPWGDVITIGLDGRLRPSSPRWDLGYSIDPILSIASVVGGVGASVSAEIPGIKDGWTKPILAAGLEFNFAHLGFTFVSLFNPSEKIYGVGAGIRTSTEEWRSLDKPEGLWVQLSIDSNGTIEHKRSTLIEQFISNEPSPLAILALLRRIKNDPMIGGVVLRFKGFAFGDGRAQEWRDALVALRQANKYVVVYLHGPSERDYYIATAAHKIFMNINSTLSLKRFQASLVYLADLLAKIGVKAEAVTAGSYKTAPRQFTNSQAQKEELEVANNLLQSFYVDLIDKIALSRNLDQDKVKSFFDGGEISAQAAKEMGLVDDAIYADDLGKSINGQEDGKLATVINYENRHIKSNQWGVIKKIAVIPIMGEIVAGRVYPSFIPFLNTKTGADDIVDSINQAVNDDDVAGILLRINSPGGDAVASSHINRALTKAQAKKPIVASMSDVAASGGYMIAAGASHILAQPNTITGSIGVFSLYFSAEELAKKTGLNSTELAPIKNPGPTLLRALSPIEREQAQKIVDWYYQSFLNTVANGLELDLETLKTNAEGRVWLGQEAFERKLVHEMGGFSQAIDSIRMLAEIPEDEELEIDIYTPGKSESFSFSSKLAPYLGISQGLADLKPLLPLTQPYLKALDSYRLSGVPQSRLPFDIVYPNKLTE